MSSYLKFPEIRWSDLDPNFHLRHSVYYDFGAYCRFSFMEEQGLTTAIFQQLHFGMILFREEAVFKKEIRMGDKISVDVELIRSRKDYSRWSMRHQIFKNESILSAIITIDGAWLNTVERKLTVPPELITNIFNKMPRSENFEWQ